MIAVIAAAFASALFLTLRRLAFRSRVTGGGLGGGQHSLWRCGSLCRNRLTREISGSRLFRVIAQHSDGVEQRLAKDFDATIDSARAFLYAPPLKLLSAWRL
jgi:hypothetical protein